MTHTTSEESIFNAALRIEDVDARQEFLANACGGNEQLRRTVEGLLAAYFQGDFLESPLVGLAGNAIQDPISEPIGSHIGSYKLLELIGEGGMGLVYMAEQTQPIRRRVALKIIKPGLDTRAVVARFEAERQALALMNHPNIASVYDAGATHLGRPYFAMELVHGLAITEYCNVRNLSLRQRLALFVEVCRAVQHAHQQGIVHRDLKPGNILVGECDGRPVVKIIDFGISKALGQERLTEKTLFTGFAHLVGTPAYMSPEQAALSTVDVDARSDVYSLGVLLYEILTGTLPFDNVKLERSNLEDVRRMILERDPPRPSSRLTTAKGSAEETLAQKCYIDLPVVRRHLRHELDWVVMKAIEKDRSRRYQTALGLSQDVLAFLHNDPLVARPPAVTYKLAKWAQKHRRSLVTACFALVLAITLIGGGKWTIDTYRHGQSLSEVIHQHEAHSQYCSDIQSAWRHIELGDRPGALALLDAHAFEKTGVAPGFEWHYMRGIASARPKRVYSGHNADILDADVSPDGRWIASSDKTGEIIVWESSTGVKVQSLGGTKREVGAVQFSPNGKWLASGGQDHLVHVWEVGTWEAGPLFEKHDASVTGVAWSPDSKLLASTGRDGFLHIWDVEKLRLLRTIKDSGDVKRCVAWSPDGSSIACGTGNDGIVVYNTGNWRTTNAFRTPGSSTLAIAFSPDSRFVAYGGHDAVVSIGEIAVRDSEVHHQAAQAVGSLAFVSDDRIVAGIEGGKIQVLEDWKNKNALPLAKHTMQTTLPCEGMVHAVVPLDGGKQLLVAHSQRRMLERFSMYTLQSFETGQLKRPAVASRDGFLLTRKDEQGALDLVEVGSWKLLAELPFKWVGPCPPAVCQATHQLAAADGEGYVRIYNSNDWREVDRVQTISRPYQLSFSPDGRFLAAGCLDACELWVFDLPNKTRKPLPNFGNVKTVKFSPCGRYLLVADVTTTIVKLFSLPDFEEIRVQHVASQIRSVDFFPDGNTVAIGQYDGAISVLTTPDLSLKATHQLHKSEVQETVLTKDGKTVVSVAGEDVCIWDSVAGREFCRLKIKDVDYPWVAFTSNNGLFIGSNTSRDYFSFGDSTPQNVELGSPNL